MIFGTKKVSKQKKDSRVYHTIDDNPQLVTQRMKMGVFTRAGPSQILHTIRGTTISRIPNGLNSDVRQIEAFMAFVFALDFAVLAVYCTAGSGG